MRLFDTAWIARLGLGTATLLVLGLVALGAAPAPPATVAAAPQDEVTELERQLANLERVVQQGRLRQAEVEIEMLHAEAARLLARKPDDPRAQRLLVRAVVARYKLLAMQGRHEEGAELLRTFATRSPAGPLELSDAVRMALLAERSKLVVGGEVGFRLVDEFRRPGAIEATLAKIEKRMQIQRNYAGALEEARELSRALVVLQGERGTGGLEEQLRDAIPRVLILEAEMLLKTGKRDQARERLERVGGPALVDGGELSPALARFYAEHRSLEAKVRALMAELREGETSPVAELVRSAIEPPFGRGKPNVQLLLQLGARAMPELERIVLEKPEFFVQERSADLLTVLVELDPGRAARFVLEHLDRGGVLWKARIVRAMQYEDVLSDGDAWPLDTGFPTTCARPGWIAVLERLLELPEVPVGAIALCDPVAYHGALTPRLRAALERALETAEGQRLDEVLGVLRRGFRNPSVRPLLEAAVTHPQERVRLVAARELLQFGAPEVLLRRGDDPDPAVRAVVATALSPRKVGVPQVGPRGWEKRNVRGEDFVPAIGERERALLLELSRDPAAEVREAAFEAVERLTRNTAVRLPADLYRAFATHPDARVRHDLARLSEGLEPDLRAELLRALAADADPDVLSAVESVVDDVPWGGREETLLAVLAARLDHPRHPTANDRFLRDVARSLGQSEVGRRGLVDLLLARPERPIPKGLAGDANWWLGSTEGATVGRLVPRLWTADPREAAELLARRVTPDGGALARAALETLHGRSRDLALELLLAPALATADVEAAASLARTALRDHAAGQRVTLQLGWLKDVLRNTPVGPRNALILAVVQDRGASAPFAAEMARWLGAGPGATEVAHATCDRWLTEPEVGHLAVAAALEHLGAHPDEATPDLLRRAVEVPRVRESAIQAMGRLRSPELLPVLKRLLRELPEATTDGEFRAAVRAVTAYLNDDAVEILLAGAARAGTEGVRAIYLHAVDSIRSYLDARAAWAARQVGAQRRAEVVADLVAMLVDDSAEVRREAARGLGSFEAAEALPHLIRRLSDPDPGVVEAVRAALDRIHRAGAEPPAEDGE